MAWIRQRNRKDGGTTYYVTWREPGATKESTLTIRDDRAEAELNKRLLDANGDSYAAAQRTVENAKIGGKTVREYMEYHISMLTRASNEQIRRYERAIKNHFSSTIGKIPLKAVTEQDVVKWLRYMQGKTYNGTPYSAKTIANHHALLSAAMRRAHNNAEIEVNPCLNVELPEDTTIEDPMRFMTVQESYEVVMAQPPRYRAFMAFLGGTGVRFGEATALLRKDFHLDAEQPYVRVEKAYKRGADNSFYVGPPKTK